MTSDHGKPAPLEAASPSGSRINDFVIKIANVNGTGSASANGLLMKSLFRMGIPVTGKNFFPSNIQGLPTWYEIRVSRDGYRCRSGQVDIMIAMNNETYAEDLAEVAPGGFFLYDATWPRDSQLSRKDVTILGIPLAGMCNEHFDQARSRILMKNVAYVGALAALLEIDMAIIRELLNETFASKAHLVDANQAAIDLGYQYAQEHFSCPLPLRLEAMDETAGHIMIDGNTAAALGCLYAGATVGAWYPITPSTSLMDAFKSYCERYRVDPESGERRFCIVQAEDELSAVGMVVGAAWAGARAFTPTSGPGISLMSEFIGFAYYTEVPIVLIDVQRVGPSTGMPTRTQQCDILSCAYASHGDTRHILLFPADPHECFELAVAAFDLAERFQTPVMMLTDLDIGMNDWMAPELQWDDGYAPDRGKVLTAEQLAEMPDFHRYADVDGDGVPWRSLPGVHPNGAYFLRGSGHTERGTYTENSEEYQRVLDRLEHKFETARDALPAPVVEISADTQVGIISIGSCDGAVREARDLLAGRGYALNYLRVKAFPFADAVDAFIASHRRIFVVEQNRDGQLRRLLLMETQATRQQLSSIRHYNGMPISARDIVEDIGRALNQEVAA